MVYHSGYILVLLQADNERRLSHEEMADISVGSAESEEPSSGEEASNGENSSSDEEFSSGEDSFSDEESSSEIQAKGGNLSGMYCLL